MSVAPRRSDRARYLVVMDSSNRIGKRHAENEVIVKSQHEECRDTLARLKNLGLRCSRNRHREHGTETEDGRWCVRARLKCIITLLPSGLASRGAERLEDPRIGGVDVANSGGG